MTECRSGCRPIKYLLVVLGLASCAVQTPLQSPELTLPWPGTCFALVHADIQIWRDQGGSPLPRPAESDRARSAVVAQLRTVLGDQPLIPLRSRLPREPLALYDLVVAESLRQQGDPMFSHRHGRLLADVGPGLASLSPCEIGLVLQGAQIPPGRGDPALMSLGAIDLNSGRVLWFHAVPLDSRGLEQAVFDLLDVFPR